MSEYVPTFRIEELPDGRFLCDVRGRLPGGKALRKRVIARNCTSRKQAQKYAHDEWLAAVNGESKVRVPTLTVAKYAASWLAARERRGLSSAVTNKYELARILPLIGHLRLAELTRADIVHAVAELKRNGKRARGGGVLSPRSIRHSYTSLRTMLADAVIERKIEHNPATLRAHRDEVPTAKDKDPLWRKSAKYTAAEIAQLASDPRLGPAERMAYALEGLAGLRFGEASALRWRDWDPDGEPLGRLHVHEAYDSNNARLKGVKMDNPREVPVHPALAELLERWWAEGWHRAYGRPPTAADLLIPVQSGGQHRHRHKNDSYDAHIRALATLELEHRRQHDLRRTFITLCRSGGARMDLLKWVSHGPPRSTIIDEYTSPPWDVLCAQVLCLRFSLLSGADAGQD
jgi:integrase